MAVSPIHRLRRFFDRVRYEWLAGRPRYQMSMDLALAAKASEDWMSACRHFSDAACVRPSAAGVRLQLGHALKEIGRIEEAEVSYRKAIRLDPNRADAYLHLGHALSAQGRGEEATAAYLKAAQSPIQSTIKGSRSARFDLNTNATRGREAIAHACQEVDRLSGELLTLKAIFEEAAVYSTEDWPSLQADFPLRPPPSLSETPIHIIIDARQAKPSAVRTSLEALSDLEYNSWSASLLVDEVIREHPVASIAHRHSRIQIVERIETISMATLLIGAGARLEPHALGWFEFLARETDADVLYADHDHHTFSTDLKEVRSRPVLLPAPGARDIVSSPETAACIWLSSHCTELATDALIASTGATARRKLLWGAHTRCMQVRHAPIILSSVWIRSDVSRPDPGYLDNILDAEEAPQMSGSILSVVPTRDQAALLNACLCSLQESAVDNRNHSIVVVDNRSTQSDTLRLLNDWKKCGIAQVLHLDEPFNWSRANNLAVKNRTDDIFLFVNNDVEIISAGWDKTLRALLSDPLVGVVGARLLYPDRTIQHAGVVMGAVGGRPVHEGRGEHYDEAGPLGRWKRTREASAVTGAFLAVRADVFHLVGGFDEDLPVAYNDLDFCLRVRDAGYDVLYCAEIEAIHHESKSRGFAINNEKIAWDDGEFRALHSRWGDAAVQDPTVNLHWTFSERRSFDGFRRPSRSAVISAAKEGRAYRLDLSYSDRSRL